MNEDSRGSERHYKGRYYVLKSQDILYRMKHPKDEETSIYAQEIYTHAPRARKNTLMLPAMRLGHARSGLELLFPLFK